MGCIMLFSLNTYVPLISERDCIPKDFEEIINYKQAVSVQITVLSDTKSLSAQRDDHESKSTDRYHKPRKETPEETNPDVSLGF